MHVLLTGASSGIGESLARALAAEGHTLTLVARREERLHQVAASCNGEHHVLPYDLSELDGITDLVARAEANGPIEMLVNNAGVQIVRRTELTPPDDAEWLLRIDTMAPFRLIHATLPGMLERGAGHIVNVASLAAIAPTAGMFYYNAAKAALAAASESLYGEVRKRGVHVLTVYPGPVKTDMADAALEKFEKDPSAMMPIGTSDVLSRRIVSALHSRSPRVIYPRSYAVARSFPGITRYVMDRMTPELLPEGSSE